MTIIDTIRDLPSAAQGIVVDVLKAGIVTETLAMAGHHVGPGQIAMAALGMVGARVLSSGKMSLHKLRGDVVSHPYDFNELPPDHPHVTRARELLGQTALQQDVPIFEGKWTQTFRTENGIGIEIGPDQGGDFELAHEIAHIRKGDIRPHYEDMLATAIVYGMAVQTTVNTLYQPSLAGFAVAGLAWGMVQALPVLENVMSRIRERRSDLVALETCYDPDQAIKFFEQSSCAQIAQMVETNALPEMLGRAATEPEKQALQDWFDTNRNDYDVMHDFSQQLEDAVRDANPRFYYTAKIKGAVGDFAGRTHPHDHERIRYIRKWQQQKSERQQSPSIMKM